MSELTADQMQLRLRCLEIAERSVINKYMSASGNMGGYHENKDIRLILSTADRFLAYVLDTNSDPQSLIAKLRDVLCGEKE